MRPAPAYVEYADIQRRVRGHWRHLGWSRIGAGGRFALTVRPLKKGEVRYRSRVDSLGITSQAVGVRVRR